MLDFVWGQTAAGWTAGDLPPSFRIQRCQSGRSGSVAQDQPLGRWLSVQVSVGLLPRCINTRIYSLCGVGLNLFILFSSKREPVQVVATRQ